MSVQSAALNEAMDAVAELELTIVPHAQITEALEALAALQARSTAKAKKGRTLKARGLLITGHAGAGKTTVIEYWKEIHPDIETDEGVIKPVLYVKVPETPTKRAIVAAILGAMGYNAPKDINSFDIIEEIRKKVELLGVLLIILDEAHHVLESKDPVDVSEFLKSLLNAIEVGIVLSGAPSLNELKTSAQFSRRLMPDVRLRPYNWCNTVERLEYLTFLGSIEKQCIDLPEPSNLKDEDIARRLYVASRGEIGLVTKYVSQALQWATTRNLPRIDLALLAEVDAAWSPVSNATDDIAFDDDISIADDADIDDLLAIARAPKIDRATNPFACKRNALAGILAERMAAPEKFARSNQRTGRRGLGKGRDEPKAFS